MISLHDFQLGYLSALQFLIPTPPASSFSDCAVICSRPSPDPMVAQIDSLLPISTSESCVTTWVTPPELQIMTPSHSSLFGGSVICSRTSPDPMVSQIDSLLPFLNNIPAVVTTIDTIAETTTTHKTDLFVSHPLPLLWKTLNVLTQHHLQFFHMNFATFLDAPPTVASKSIVALQPSSAILIFGMLEIFNGFFGKVMGYSRWEDGNVFIMM